MRRLRPRVRRPMRLTGFRLRMVAAFTIVAVLSSVAASGIAYHLVRRAMLQRTQDAVLNDVRETVARLVPPNLPPRSTVADRLRDALRTRPGRKVVVRELPRDSTKPLDPDVDGSLDVPVSQRFIAQTVNGMVYQRIVRKGRPYLLVGARAETWDESEDTEIVVFVSVSLRAEAAELRSFTSAVLLADALGLVVALALALMAARGVLLPVRRLGRAAGRLGEGRLDTRVEVHGSDELADLAQTFNRTADALERTVAELRSMEEASRRFVADVSHELRTPLTAMVAVTDVLTDGERASADHETATRLVVEETKRLQVLVEHLIEISRFDAGAAKLVLDDVVVAESVAAALTARGWTEQISVAGPASLTVRLDPRRFDVILANLAGNAIKHGRPPVELRFDRATRDGTEGLELTVTDHGPGIPADLIGLVFDRFVKADTARSRSEGSGLGLSIARANAVLHGGSLEAAGALGGGARFTLWLPEGGPE